MTDPTGDAIAGQEKMEILSSVICRDGGRSEQIQIGSSTNGGVLLNPE